MKTNNPIAKTNNLNTLTGRLRTAGATRMLPLLLLLTLPAAVQAQDYAYSVNDDNTITITGYNGSDNNLTIPDTILVDAVNLPVTSIGDWSFFYYTSLTSIAIPNSVTNIGAGAFYYCSGLTNISMPNSITSISDYTFASCSSLTSLTIPNGVTSIGSDAFADDNSLASVPLPNSVTSIDGNAFAGCSSLTSITIPNSVTNLGASAFAFCSGLTGIYFLGDIPYYDPNGGIFESTKNVTVYYMQETVGWDNFTPQTAIPSMLWNPQVQTSDASFGLQANRFGFNITTTNNFVVVVQACTDLVSPIWSPVWTNAFAAGGGTSYFSDPQWMNYSTRYYRLRWP